MREHRPVPVGEDVFRVEALGPRLCMTTISGRISWSIAESAYNTFVPIVEEMSQPVWVSDATLLTGFEPKTLTLGPRWFVAFKRRGGCHCLVVSRWERALMAARTMALGLGVKIQVCSSVELALRSANKLLDEAG